MSTSYYNVELEQDAYGSAVIPLPDELCLEDDIITLKRVAAGYDIEE